MADNYDLNNLVLNDNYVDVVPPGTYRFKVNRVETDYYTGKSEKIPNGCQQLIVYMDIPYTSEDGVYRVASVKNTINIYAKTLFRVRSLAECLGMCNDKGQAKINKDDMPGKIGTCLVSNVERNGNKYTQIEDYFPRNKAPKAANNDKEWEDFKNGRTPVQEADVPW